MKAKKKCQTCFLSDICEETLCNNPDIAKEIQKYSNQDTGQEFNLSNYLFSAVMFFSENGYTCDAADVFSLIGQFRESVNIEMFLKTIFVHDRNENMRFAYDYRVFKSRYFLHDKTFAAAINKRDDAESRHKRDIEQMSRMKNRIEDEKNSLNADEKILALMEQAKLLDAEKTPHLKACLKDAPSLCGFCSKVQELSFPEKSQVLADMKMAAKKAIRYDNYEQIMESLHDRYRFFCLFNKANSLGKRLIEIQKNLSDIEKEMADRDASFQNELKTILKNISEVHRTSFINPHNAVQSYGYAEFDKAFVKLSEAEKKMVQEYVFENARKFRTKLTKRIRTSATHKIDIPQTIKKACGTGGIPIRLEYEKPERQKANLVMFLEVSGSCKNAAEFMLIFMSAMKSVFPGGCHTYAFTNRLYDISPLFETMDTSGVAEQILNSIPRAGAYSNYEVPFRQFYEEHMAEVTGDSYVYFIGDARNNKNDPGLDYVRAISRKAKKSFWLNTDPYNKWDQGDSIISLYKPYMNEIICAETPKQLLAFLER